MNEETSTLRSLANIILRAVDSMERAYAQAALPLPSLDKSFEDLYDVYTFDPGDPAEALTQDPRVVAASKNLVAACAQISATVSNPRRIAINHAHGQLNEMGIDIKLKDQIFCLSACHIFREVSPGVFANNRISSTLDKGKPSRELSSNRETRFVGSSGIAALVEHAAEMGGKSAQYLAQSLRTPGLLPFNLGYDTKESFFEWMERPESIYHVNRFAVAMQGTTAMEPEDLNVFRGFKWSALPYASVIVDVGGGIGHVSLAVAKKYPHLRVVNQDFASPIEISKAHWKECFPDHLDKQMVDFHVHDFFNPQPVRNAAVFLLRQILHDWPDDKAVVILKNLSEAAQQETQLVVIEKVVPFASTQNPEDSKACTIRGAKQPVAEAPLLPNWGAAAADIYPYDLMHTFHGGIERTAQGFYELFAKGGWKLIEIHQSAGTQMSHLVGVPA
ncbi:O-methyltransferase-domain-containing protein [Favolaschia claudopus]|uniref:O-methyltransferase-domain-containing protein n=1 Tax=Favolaschia claudopus TaxID=2862362 RepID=A0AAW0AHL4_9AGAR